MDSRLQGVIAPALALLVVASWAAVLFAGNAPSLALASLGVGWAALFTSMVIAWPSVPRARTSTELADVARKEGAPSRIPLVGYNAYLTGSRDGARGSRSPVVIYVGELEPGFERDDGVREALVWTPERFWKLWKSDRPVLVLVRLQDLVELMMAAPPARVVRYAGRSTRSSRIFRRAGSPPSPALSPRERGGSLWRTSISVRRQEVSRPKGGRRPARREPERSEGIRRAVEPASRRAARRCARRAEIPEQAKATVTGCSP